MLDHSPPLPLVLDYSDEYSDFTAEDEERTILALKQRNRIRRVRLRMDVATLRKLTVAIKVAIDGVFPSLEYLIIIHPSKENSTAMMLPETFQAPHLRQLVLGGFVPPRVLATTVGLVTLVLSMDHPSTYIHPNTLLQYLSFMPWLETLKIIFLVVDPNHDVEGQLTHTPITTSITLPNLRRIWYRGLSVYLEAVLCRITTPRLDKLCSTFFWEPTYSVPCLLRFINTTKSLSFERAKIMFTSNQALVNLYPHRSRKEYQVYALCLNVNREHLDVQVSFAAQISKFLSQAFTSVERLTFEHSVHSRSSEEHNEVDQAEWRKLLSSFRNLKSLRIAKGLVEALSRFLDLEDREHPFELLPELQELVYVGISDSEDEFTSFVDARRKAGRPVALVRKTTLIRR
jgi:hypothetical protein